MVRIISACLIAFGVVALASAAFIRFELAEPGIGPTAALTLTSNTGWFFQQLVTIHGKLALIAYLFVGLLMGAVSVRDNGAPDRVWIWPGLGVAVVALGGLVALSVPLGQHPSGWALYPPATGYFDPVSGEPSQISVFLQFVTSDAFLLAVANGAVVAGAASLLFRPNAPQSAVFVGLVALAGVAISLGFTATFFFGQAVFISLLSDHVLQTLVPIVVLWLTMLVQSIRRVVPIDPYLSVAGLMVATSIPPIVVLSVQEIDRAYHDTYYVVGSIHLSLTGFALFAGFIALRHLVRSSLRPIWLWLHAFALGIAQVVTFFPQYVLGRQGMPRRYIDYPEAFEFWNQISSTGAIALALLVARGVFVMARFRAPRDAA